MDQEPTGPVTPPQQPTSPVGPTQEEKTHAMLSWILMILGCLGWVGPLVFLVTDKEKPFVRKHAATGLTTFITLLVVGVVLWVVVFAVVFVAPMLAMLMLPVWLLIGAANLVCIIMGAIKASSGEPFEPPVIGGIAKSLFKV